MAAVVGVIANLFLWFGINLFFTETTYIDIGVLSFVSPDFTSLNIRVVAIAIVCGWLAIWQNVGLFWLLGIAASGGILAKIIAIG